MTAAKPLPRAPQPALIAANQTIDQLLPVVIQGRFLTHDSQEFRLVTVAMSCRSAQLRAHVRPPSGSQIVCYFDELGRVAGTVASAAEGGFHVAFSTTEHKREKIADRLIWLVNKGPLGLTDERKATRYDAAGPALVRLSDGRTVQCRVVDISLTGAGFEALGRSPRLGEIVSAGTLTGEVVRVTGRSFGIRFVH